MNDAVFQLVAAHGVVDVLRNALSPFGHAFGSPAFFRLDRLFDDIAIRIDRLDDDIEILGVRVRFRDPGQSGRLTLTGDDLDFEDLLQPRSEVAQILFRLERCLVLAVLQSQPAVIGKGCSGCFPPRCLRSGFRCARPARYRRQAVPPGVPLVPLRRAVSA